MPKREMRKWKGIVGGWGIPGVNANGKLLLDMCKDRYVPGKVLYDYKLIHRYPWN